MTRGESDECAAARGERWGLHVVAVRPRRADDRFLRSLVDAGLPATSVTVSVTTLRQARQSVPTPLVVEGRRHPRRIGNSLASFVVTHPDATFIVDPSVCVDAEKRAVAQLPAFLRMAVRPPDDVIPTVTALRESAMDAAGIDFALPTHAHWDHVCGLLDLPHLPVYLHRREHDWVMTGPVAPVGGVRDSLLNRTTVGYDLDGPPVLTFASSHDLFGDGSVVLVDLAGHTPGSVGVLLNTVHRRVLLAGDAAWHTQQVEHIRQKSSYPGGLADVDRSEAFRTLHRLHAVKDRVTVVAPRELAICGVSPALTAGETPQVATRDHPIGMVLHGPLGTHATPPPGPATAHGPPGTPAETWPLDPACAPGPPGTSAPAPCGPAEGAHGVPSALKHGGGGGGSATATGALTIAAAAAPTNKAGVNFFKFTFMLFGYHAQASVKPTPRVSGRKTRGERG